MKRSACAGYGTATYLPDWLVRVAGLPFREAHHVTGRIVAMASGTKAALEKLPLADMQAIEPRITDEVFAVLGVERSVRSRTSHGGTARFNVRREAKRWLARLQRKTPPPGGGRSTPEASGGGDTGS